MHQLIHGNDTASRLPVDPVSLGPDEEQARIQAMESQVVVRRVDVIHREAEAIESGAERATSLPAQASVNAASTGSERPRPRRRWRFACVVLFALVVGFAMGNFFPRDVLTGFWSSGARVTELEPVESLLRAVGQNGIGFEYSGSNLEFWIEIDSQGEKQTIGPWSGGANFYPLDQDKTVKGHLLFLRSQPDEAGIEKWTVATRFNSYSAAPPADPIGNLVGLVTQGQAPRALPLAGCTGRGFTEEVKVWKGTGSGNLIQWGSNGCFIPSPLPADQEVCIKEILEERQQIVKSLRLTDESSMTVLGLLASPHGPLLAINSLDYRIEETTNEATEELKIRIMCKAVTKKTE